jgi:predicted methyltransferase
MFRVILKVTEMAQKYVKEVLKSGDTAVDATLGNGWDTLFLSSLVEGGHVYSFDIQKEATDKCVDILKAKAIQNVSVVNDGHENIDLYVKERPRVVMFNLGYLPGGDEVITTKTSTTLEGIKKSLNMLLPGGIITICVYTGHSEGKAEGTAVMEYLSSLNPRIFSVSTMSYLNKSSNPPCLILVEKNDNGHGDKQNNPC